MRVLGFGTSDEDCRRTTLRLRDAVLVSGHEDSQDHCDAALFIGPTSPAANRIEAALESGIHVLLATDSCLPESDLTRLAQAATQRGVQFSVVNPDRYLPSRRLIRNQLDTGKLGEPGLIRIHRWDAAATNRALVRDLDLAVWLCRRPVALVFAVAQSGYVQVHLGFVGGAMALIDHAEWLPPGDGYQSLSVIASAGAAHADDHANRQLVFRGGLAQAVAVTERAAVLPALAAEFVEAIRRNHDLSAGLGEWRHVWAVVAAMQRSLETRQPMQVGAVE